MYSGVLCVSLCQISRHVYGSECMFRKYAKQKLPFVFYLCYTAYLEKMWGRFEVGKLQSFLVSKVVHILTVVKLLYVIIGGFRDSVTYSLREL